RQSSCDSETPAGSALAAVSPATSTSLSPTTKIDALLDDKTQSVDKLLSARKTSALLIMSIFADSTCAWERWSHGKVRAPGAFSLL
ncbi:unnamed protein product, partial [Linum tenue]